MKKKESSMDWYSIGIAVAVLAFFAPEVLWFIFWLVKVANTPAR